MMDNEKMMLISVIVVFYLTQIFSGIGLSMISSKEPVGIFPGIKEPREEQIKNVFEWNNKLGFMWLDNGSIIFVSFIIALMFQENLNIFITILCGFFTAFVYTSVKYRKIKRRLLIN